MSNLPLSPDQSPNQSGLEIILLAAGASRRLGHPKQLVEINGEPMLVQAIKQAATLNCPVTVITGAYREKVEPLVASLENSPAVTVKYNPDWQQGMGTSIRSGVEALSSNAKAVMIMLCDQPRIPTAHYQTLYQQWLKQPKQAVASQYPSGSLGVPAIFPKALFSELMTLSGDSGAKRVISALGDQINIIPCWEAEFDLDTQQQVGELAGN